MYIEQLWRLTYMSPLHCETEGAWMNLFFTVLIIKLRMFEGYENV